MKNNFLVIMAGGIGSRFWPMSTEKLPKQFHDILGIGKTLLQLTLERFEKICPIENIFIITNEQYFDITKSQLPMLNDNQIIGEAFRRNTAPCIAYAAHKINKINKNANMIVAPSDHIILNQTYFEEVIHSGINCAENQNALVTIGIEPSRPDTGYGYIEYELKENCKYNKVIQFKEKPNRAKALEYMSKGNFVWNSGMFIWKNSTILNEFSIHLPNIHQLFTSATKYYNTAEEKTHLLNIYEKCSDISIDYGIMEKATNVITIPSQLQWSDLGTWRSLYDQLEKSDNGNTIKGNKIIISDSENNLIHLSGNKKCIIHGLNEYIVVDQNDMLLICKMEDEQKIKSLVSKLSS